MIYHQELGRFHTDWHSHAYGELVYAEQGCIHLNAAGRKLLVPGRYAVWIPPGTLHEMWSDSPHLQMRAVCFPPVWSPDLKDELAVFPVSGLMREMIRHTGQWHLAGQDRREVHTFLQAMQDLLPSELSQRIPAFLPSTAHNRLAPVLDSIQKRLHKKVSIQELARDHGMSVRTLTRLFTQNLRVSFSVYCKIARIMKALEHIEEGTYNVSDLAMATGYESLAAFSNSFLEVCGTRPLQYMKSRLPETYLSDPISR